MSRRPLARLLATAVAGGLAATTLALVPAPAGAATAPTAQQGRDRDCRD